MKVLVLGPAGGGVAEWLTAQGETVSRTEAKISGEMLDALAPEFVISRNYRYLIPEEVIARLPGRIINLHISYLPWNRGADPNVWSFIDDTPKGVTIHLVDAGIDTGDILVQEEVTFPEGETLQSSYEKLQAAIIRLFQREWHQLKRGTIVPQAQAGPGSRHGIKDAKLFAPLIREKGWATPVTELRQRAKLLGLGAK